MNLINYLKKILETKKPKTEDTFNFVNSVSLDVIQNLLYEKVFKEDSQYIVFSGNSSPLLEKNDVVGTLRIFFSKYEKLNVINSDLGFDLNCVKRMEIDKNYIQVGSDVGYLPVVFDEQTEEVFVFDMDFDGSIIPDLKAKSIWHYLMINLCLVYADLFDELKVTNKKKI